MVRFKKIYSRFAPPVLVCVNSKGIIIQKLFFTLPFYSMIFQVFLQSAQCLIQLVYFLIPDSKDHPSTKLILLDAKGLTLKRIIKASTSRNDPVEIFLVVD